SQVGNVVGTALLSDTVTITGGYVHTGTITFTLTAPNGTTAATQTVTVTSGVDVYTNPTAVLATQGGTYTWHATYTEDGLNNGASDDGTNETLTTVKASPSLTTSASATLTSGSTVLSDVATVTGGYLVTGTITFTLTGPDGTTNAVGTVSVTG